MHERMLPDIAPYDYNRHFFIAAERALSYIKGIKTCEFAFSFWMDFDQIDQLGVATAMDKAILLAALLRSFESEDARVIVTKKGKIFVRFLWKDAHYFVSTETGSLISGEESLKLFSDDVVAYAFNDLMYENYEET